MEFSKKRTPANPALRREAKVSEYGIGSVAHRVTGRHGASEEERSVVHRSKPGRGAPESPRSVGIERPDDLVVGLERSYKGEEEVWESH